MIYTDIANFDSFFQPKEWGHGEDMQWVEHVHCEEGYVDDDGCDWEGDLSVVGSLGWRDHSDGTREVTSRLYDWVCPRCGTEYQVEDV